MRQPCRTRARSTATSSDSDADCATPPLLYCSSDTQVKVRDATSNDPWGPSGTQMNELAQLSYNQ